MCCIYFSNSTKCKILILSVFIALAYLDQFKPPTVVRKLVLPTSPVTETTVDVGKIRLVKLPCLCSDIRNSGQQKKAG